MISYKREARDNLANPPTTRNILKSLYSMRKPALLLLNVFVFFGVGVSWLLDLY